MYLPVKQPPGFVAACLTARWLRLRRGGRAEASVGGWMVAAALGFLPSASICIHPGVIVIDVRKAKRQQQLAPLGGVFS